MLLSVTGASGTGKSTALAALGGIDLGAPVTCVEFDSMGVPDEADTAWRHGATEHWVGRALEAQARGEHVVLFGQVAPGELLAAPSADRLDGIAVCVLHCSSEVQEARLIGRGEPADSLVHHLRFGQWFRQHAEDPRHAPEVIRVDSTVPMVWSRWEGLHGSDPRWPVRVIETDDLSRAEVAERLLAWARDELSRHAEGNLAPAGNENDHAV